MYKDINDLFPLTVADGNARLNGKLNVPEALEAKFGIDLTNAIKSVMFSIDGNNSSLVIEQRAAYSGYATNPCAQSDWYQRQLEDLSNRRHRLQEQERLLNTLLALAGSSSSNKEELIGVLKQLVDRLPPEEAALMTIDEMDDSEKTAIEMTQGADNDS